MDKVKFSPEHLAFILQVEFPRRNYRLLEVELKGHNGEKETITVTDRNTLNTISYLFKTLSVGTTPVPNKSFQTMTCHSVAYVEEYKYGLKVFMLEGLPYKTITIKIDNFQPSEG